jgi:formylmethanofuran dehydrogenase subunit E
LAAIGFALAVLAVGLGCLRTSADASAAEDFFPIWAKHSAHNQPLWVLDTESALGRLSKRPKRVALKDLALVHGHLCDGLVISWVAVGAALRPLFPDGIVDRTDLRAVSRNGPCWVDAAAWMTGARVNHGTLILDNSIGAAFVVQRMSTLKTVRVRLREGVYPEELARLERSIRERRASSQAVELEEIRRFENEAADFSRRILSADPAAVVEVIRLRDFTFPEKSPDLIVPRSDIINRDPPETGRRAEEKQP